MLDQGFGTGDIRVTGQRLIFVSLCSIGVGCYDCTLLIIHNDGIPKISERKPALRGYLHQAAAKKACRRASAKYDRSTMILYLASIWEYMAHSGSIRDRPPTQIEHTPRIIDQLNKLIFPGIHPPIAICIA